MLNDKTYLLHIESSCPYLSVSLSLANNILQTVEIKEKNKHSETIGVVIKGIIDNCNIMTSDIKAVSISKGPGSYTGLRVGVSFAKAFCFVNNIPLISVSSLRALAQTFYLEYKNKINSENINIFLCPTIQAHKNIVYFAIFDSHLKRITQDEANEVNENLLKQFNTIINNKKIIFIGSGAKIFLNLKDFFYNPEFFENVYPKSEALVNYAFEKYTNKNYENLINFKPNYITNFIPNLYKKKSL